MARRRRRYVSAPLLCLCAALLGPTSASAEIVGTLEKPGTGAVATGIDNIQGWVFTTAPEATIETLLDVFIDDEFVMNVPCCSDRADVRGEFPQAPLRTGFSGAFNFGLLAPEQPHIMRVIARSTAGEMLEMVSAFIAVRVGPFPFSTSAEFVPGASDCAVTGGGETSLSCTGFRVESPTGQVSTCASPSAIFLSWDRAKQNFTVDTGCTAP